MYLSRCSIQKVPKNYDHNLLENTIQNLNDFPSKESLSQTMSPAAIVEGVPKPDMKYKRISFGSYALVWVRTTNTMKRRAIPSITLKSSNRCGGYYFMSLNTGRRLHSYHWTQLPIPDDVIERVETMAEKENQPLLVDNVTMFEWQPGTPMIFSDIPSREEDTQDSTIDENNQGQNSEENNTQPVEIESIDDSDHEESLVIEHNDDENVDFAPGPNLIEDDSTIHNPSHNDLSLVIDDNEEIYADEHAFITDDSDDLSYSSYSLTELQQDHEVSPSTDNNTSTSYDADDEIIAYEPDDDTHLSFDAEELTSNEGADNDDNTQPPSRPQRTNAGTGIPRLAMSFDGKSYSTITHKQFLTMKQKALNHIVQQKEQSKNQHSFEATLLQKAVDIIFTLKQSHKPSPSPQMSAKQGIIKYGELAVAAIMKEFKQLVHGAFPDKPVVEAIKASDLSEKDKQTALDVVNLIKVKKDGTVKGRTCANGSKEKFFINPEESIASPTASIEAIISTLLIDVYENRDIAIFDIPGAYLHAEMPSKHQVLLNIKDEFVDIMCKVNPDFEQYVTIEKGRKVLYLKVLRAIYGCIRSVLLWYNLYRETLEKDGYKVNPYNRCVANKEIDGNQCSIVWYVDDNKISHVNEKVDTREMDKLSEHFGNLSIQRGNSFDFLGMTIKVDRDKKRVHISMEDHIDGAIEMFGEELRSEINSPAYRDLFITYDEKSNELDQEKSEIFHRVVAKLLFIAKRARPDIETAMSYLTTRVSKSNERDWYELKRLMSFLKNTKKDDRIIGAASLYDLFTWVDASYAIHPDMRGHTEGLMSYGTGVVHAKSSKQKLNVKSSTECEIVGVSEYTPFNIWLMMFMEAQGYTLKNNILFQDNQSSIRMEKNGRNSCTGNSRHVHIRYFFVKDRVDKGEITIKYCPTHLMLADFFTKPLTGKLFHFFRDIVMGYKDIDSLNNNSFSLKERIGNVSEKQVESKNKGNYSKGTKQDKN